MKKYTFKNFITFLIEVIPELKNAPGFEPEDIELPYVLFAQFSPFIFNDIKNNKGIIAQRYLKNLSDITMNSNDETLLSLIKEEVVDDFMYKDHVFTRKHKNFLHKFFGRDAIDKINSIFKEKTLFQKIFNIGD